MNAYELYHDLHLHFFGRWYGRNVRKHPRLANFNPFGVDGWKVKEVFADSVLARKGETELLTCKYHAGCLLSEARAWRRYYVPPFSLEGKTVMDVGAGCGETAALFFTLGAKKVVAIESQSECCYYLSGNAFGNQWDVELIPEPFVLEHLSIPHDFLKVDIEGGESLLLDYDRPLGPCRVEIHSTVIGSSSAEAIVRKHGLRRASLPGTEVFGRDD